MGRLSGYVFRVILWDEREYSCVRHAMADGAAMPDTYAEWLENTNRAISVIEKEGGRPAVMEVNLADIVKYCDLQGLNLDVDGRSAFVNAFTPV